MITPEYIMSQRMSKTADTNIIKGIDLKTKFPFSIAA